MNSDAQVSNTPTRTITLEEHFATPEFLEGPGGHLKHREQNLLDQLCDLGDRRIADMDAAEIDVQVLSLTAPGVDQLDTKESVELARETNDLLADAMRNHPSSFSGFACLPTSDPNTAADELERVVREHGYKGGIINGHCQGRYMDDEFFWPILERAESLQVPLYLHPTPPPKRIVEAYYT